MRSLRPVAAFLIKSSAEALPSSAWQTVRLNQF